MELWDVYDENRLLTGRKHVRGQPLAPGDFHIVVFVWIRSAAGLFLCSKRHPDKIGWPGAWECTGGAALSGEDSLTAAVREVREELGIALDPAAGQLVHGFKRGNCFCDVWLFHHNVGLSDIVFQEGETCDANWFTGAEIIGMAGRGDFAHPVDYFPHVFGITAAHE